MPLSKICRKVKEIKQEAYGASKYFSQTSFVTMKSKRFLFNYYNSNVKSSRGK